VRIILFILVATILSCKSSPLTKAQEKLKKDAITLNSLTNVNDQVYDKISPFEIIMIGEMHGTNEPAAFAYGLCNLISQHEAQVIMAMEISPTQMKSYHDSMTLDQLKELPFFESENYSGMNGQAWLDLILHCNQNKNIIIQFFDYQRDSPRDSSMYNAIYDISNTYPDTKIVTLSGNLHNRLEPYREKLMLGGYLMNDTINFNRDKIMSVMHFFNFGTMQNNMGNGLELKTIESKDNIFNKTLSENMFFCENIFDNQKHFTHILYTNEVTHSELIAKN